MDIKTDHRWKPFRYQYEVPENVLKEQFSHLTGDDDVTDGYFEYKDHWYHISDFLSVPQETGGPNMLGEVFHGWHGYASDSAFSGVLIKVSHDGEQYMVGTYFS